MGNWFNLYIQFFYICTGISFLKRCPISGEPRLRASIVPLWILAMRVRDVSLMGWVGSTARCFVLLFVMPEWLLIPVLRRLKLSLEWVAGSALPWHQQCVSNHDIVMHRSLITFTCFSERYVSSCGEVPALRVCAPCFGLHGTHVHTVSISGELKSCRKKEPRSFLSTSLEKLHMHWLQNS